MRRVAWSVVVTLLAGAGLLLTPAGHGTASAETGVAVTDKCSLDADALRFNVLLLLDASWSLRRTDPDNARRDGLEAVTSSLASLEGTWSHLNQEPGFNFQINVAVDTFATGYTRHHGWQEAGVSQLELLGRYGDITALPEDVEITLTDYRQALRGASQRFSEVPSEGCNLLLWFTDGEHATRGTSTDVSSVEWDELRDLCRSEAMRLLSNRNVWTQAVLLSSGSPSVAPLSLLFGDLSGGCRHELDGEISQLNTGELVSILDELIAEVVPEVVCVQQTPDLLPGEEDACITEEPRPCADDASIPGNGTAESPCLYRFTLPHNAESFRLSVDMTFVNRGIRNPSEVNMRLQSPSGRQSQLISAAEDASGYQPVAPFWFLSRRLYDSRWEIIAHQAAEQLAREADWEWAGEWTMQFWGDSAAAAEDAARAAAAIRVNTREAPSAEMTLSEEGQLVGFIQNFPQDYLSADLRLRLDDGAGAPIYPTRPHLVCQEASCNPLPVEAEQGHRFEVSNVNEEALWWNTDEAGGDGTRLITAIDQLGTVSAVAELEQEFLYGGVDGYGPDGERGQPLRWRRDIGRVELDLSDFIADQDRLEDEKQKDQEGVDEAKRQWDELQELVQEIEDGDTVGLPSVTALDDQPESDLVESEVEFDVSATPGYFPGTATLEEVSLRIEGEAAKRQATHESWTCGVPGTWAGGSGAEVACETLPVDLGLSEDATATAELMFGISLAEGVEETLRARATYEGIHQSWEPSDEEWEALWRRLEAVALGERQTRLSRAFDVDLPTAGDKLREFLPFLILLVVLAALSRVVAAWRLRPWSPLASAEYLVQSVDAPSESGSWTVSGAERQLCMPLRGRSASAQMSGVHLFSMWMPVLFGGPPRLAVKSPNRQCIGPRGSMKTRRGASSGEHLGLVGSHPKDGWTLEISPTGNRLFIWDLPDDDNELRTRLSEAERVAFSNVGQVQEAASKPDGATRPEGAEAVPPPTQSDEGDDPFAAGSSRYDTDPFSSGPVEGVEDSSQINPFGPDPTTRDPFSQ